jgi:hypothetical protein
LDLGSSTLDSGSWILDLGSGGDPGPCALVSFVPPGNIELIAQELLHEF